MMKKHFGVIVALVVTIIGTFFTIVQAEQKDIGDYMANEQVLKEI